MVTTTIPADIDGRIAQFTSFVEPLGVTVARLAGSADVAAFLADLTANMGANRSIISSELTSAAPELVRELNAAGVSWINPASVDDARDQLIGVSVSSIAVAETGSIMLAELTLPDRAVGLLTMTHVTVIRTSDLAGSLSDAARALREVAMRPGGGYGTLVTGPSRTADIEMSLTVGVQGPKRVLILFVDNLQ